MAIDRDSQLIQKNVIIDLVSYNFSVIILTFSDHYEFYLIITTLYVKKTCHKINFLSYNSFLP